MRRIHLHLIGWLSLFTAGAGLLHPALYTGLVPETMIPGVISQDAVTIPLAVFLIISAFRSRGLEGKNRIAVLGILGYIFYAYGIYVIERVYNLLYFAYLALFSLSFFVGMAGIFEACKATRAALPKPLRYVSAVFLGFNPLLFYPLWISQMLPLLRERKQIDSIYSIYILDLGFVMPAFIILTVLVLRDRSPALLLTPALFIKGFTLLFSVALGGLLKPFFGQSANAGEIAQYLGLALVFLILTVILLSNIRLDTGAQA
jgi:hypothetical protein